MDAADPGDVLVPSGARGRPVGAAHPLHRLGNPRVHREGWWLCRWMVGRACLSQSLGRGGPVPEGLFTNDLFRFLRDLKRHNDRAWFAKNKERYVEAVQEPALEFVRAFAPSLAKISPQFVADDRPVGGSLSRIY